MEMSELTALIKHAKPTGITLEKQGRITPEEAKKLYKQGKITDKSAFICGKENLNGQGICQVKVTCKSLEGKQTPCFVAHKKDEIHTCSIQNEHVADEKVRNGNKKVHARLNLESSIIDYRNSDTQPRKRTGVDGVGPDIEKNNRKKRGANGGGTSRLKGVARHIHDLDEIVDVFCRNKFSRVNIPGNTTMEIRKLFRVYFKFSTSGVIPPYPNAKFIFYSRKATIHDHPWDENQLEIRTNFNYDDAEICIHLSKAQVEEIFPHYGEFLNDDNKIFSVFSPEKPVLSKNRRFLDVDLNERMEDIESLVQIRTDDSQ